VLEVGVRNSLSFLNDLEGPDKFLLHFFRLALIELSEIVFEKEKLSVLLHETNVQKVVQWDNS
jgi:hypothetical protein